ncbi:lysophospholipid acyltransferase family protein [Alistipes sp. OttesenSCG-928-B03]|nr:lysophospholipid acyltransferase family protein [Alistipes sp. OttesenSCG-928-B03]
MHLIEKKDLMMGRTGVVPSFFAGTALRMLGLNRINRLYEETFDEGGDTAEKVLAKLDVKYTICDKDRSNIPAEGGVVFISNHPTGLLDGILLIDLLSRVRPDVKFMGNFLLDRIESLRKYFIAVDPFDSKDAKKNLRGVRQAIKHVQDGGALVIFPAGEVATWQKGFNQIKDKKWSRSIVRFIRSTEAPVVPICIEARNSRLFRLVGLVHPVLRTALLPRELLNKKGKTVNINIGSAIMPRRVAQLKELDVYGDYLRANVDYLHKKLPRRKLRIIPRRKPLPKVTEEIIAPVDPAVIAAELAAIREGHLMFEHANYDVYCAHPDLIPSVMREIGRLREVTFRSIGEGTMKSIDTDFYDTYYHQMFIWDRDTQMIIGAYRLGMGDEIAPRFGLKGFYVNSLFRMKKEMLPVMEKTIELGRSFVIEEYQRKPVSLMLLWKGILYVLLKHEQYRNLLGPVTISGEFDKYSKTVIVRHLQQHHFNHKIARYVKPVTGLEGINAPIDDSLIECVGDIELINKLVRDIERDEMSIPILIKKYLQLNSHVIGFNVDHDFADGLDALMLLDLKKMPESTINLLSKEITDIDVIGRFRNYHS